MIRDSKISTQEALKQAFLALYEQKDINRIFVTEITERSGYSRNTFYLYFHNPYDLLESLEEDVAHDTCAGITSVLRFAISGASLEDFPEDAAAVSALLGRCDAINIMLHRKPNYTSALLAAADTCLRRSVPALAILSTEALRVLLAGVLFLAMQKNGTPGLSAFDKTLISATRELLVSMQAIPVGA